MLPPQGKVSMGGKGESLTFWLQSVGILRLLAAE